jgi:tetratricopeptide (TPR) repeat protein
MSEKETYPGQDEEIEAALLDAELFLKYQAPHRAIVRLKKAVEQQPRSIAVREKLREVAASNKQPDEAARQCLALANLYLAREDFETAQERLLQAKQLDPRISIATGLEAIRQARHPELAKAAHQTNGANNDARRVTLAGDLTAVSIFDAIQVIENARLTGALAIHDDAQQILGRILCNEGRIVGANCGDTNALDAFRQIVQITNGGFDFEKSTQDFPVTIQAPTNTNLILDSLRQIDEEKM